jgi:2-keto-4-pentenoate hydratase/2-oxohepta-3-ene-1,7-dioic acid hydratase in catechol pathway
MEKYCRFTVTGTTRYGVVRGDSVEGLSAAPWRRGQPTGKTHALSGARLLAPCEPSKIVCVGRSYKEHAAELGNPLPKEPLLFLKPPSSVIGPEEAIIYPAMSKRVDHEGELALVMGKRCRRLKPEENPLDFVFGYTCLNDVTARDIQKADGQFTRGKGFDTFCPLGPVIATGIDGSDLSVESFVNSERRQAGRTSEMVFTLGAIIRHIAEVMTLEPGDVIATGTPPGVGPLQPGDVVEVVVEGVGRLRNPVVAAGD